MFDDLKVQAALLPIGVALLSVFLLVPITLAQEKPATVDSLVQVKLTESAKTQFVGADGALPEVVSQARTGVEALDQLARQYNVNRMERVFRPAGKHEPRHVRAGLDRWYTIHYQSDVTSETVAKSYLNSSSVEASSPVYKIDLKTNRPSSMPVGEENTTQNYIPNDPRYEDQWHYNNTSSNVGTPDADIDLREAHSLESGNPEVIISISDNGTDLDHPDIQNRLWINEEEDINGNGVFDPYPADEGGDLNGEDDDDNGFDDDVVGYDHEDSDPNPSPNSGESHGTHVAGTVAAQNGNEQYGSGVAGGDGTSDSGVRLMINRAHENQNVAQAAESITYAADNGALVSNASWGEGWILDPIFRPPIRDAIDYFRETAGGEGTPMNGGIFVSSAGNAGEPVGDYFPARYGPTFTVGATDANDDRASYSNYGDEVDISAPGGDGNIPDSWVQSTMVDDEFGGMPGTSMAAPHVSGVIALVASALAEEGLTISNEAMENKLVNNADDVGNPDIGPRVNAFKALSALGFLNPTLSLTDGTNTPSSGTTDDTFTFEVTYTSQVNFEPDNVSLHLGGETYTMQSTGSDYSNGVVFETSVSNLSSGTYEYHFEATVSNEHVDEQLRDPAEGSHEFTVTESASGYDLEVASAELSDTSPSPGSSFDITSNVQNIGGEIYSLVPLSMELAGPNGNIIDEAETSISLDPGDNVFNTLSLSLPSGASDGQYQVTVRVEPDLDENPSNNQVTRSFLIGETLATNQYAIDNVRHVSTDPDAINSDPDFDGLYPYLQGPSVNIGGSTFEVEGISDEDILINDPSGNYVILAKGEVRYWPDYEASMSIAQIDVWNDEQKVVYIWAGPETTQGPSFDSREITAPRGQAATFEASAPSSGEFEDQDEDIVFIEEDDPESSDYRDWFDDFDTDGDQAEISFDVPSSADITSHGFSVMTRHEGGTGAYLSTVDINVVGSPSISVDPSSFSTSVEQGGTVSREIEIENSGSAALTWSLSSNADWLGPDDSGSLGSGNSTSIPVTIGEEDLAPGTFEGQFTITSNDESSGTVSIEVTHTVESVPQSAITLDGQIDESVYISVGGNSGDDETGFGSANDIDSLMYYPDEENDVLYIAASGILEAGNTNGYGFYINVSGSGAPSGKPAGNSLGLNRSTNYHFLTGQQGGTNDDFTADFEVDAATAVAPISETEAAAHLANYTGSSPTVTALDTTDQNGTPVGSGVQYALLNSEAPMTGVEWKIPFSALGTTADQNIQVSAFVVSSKAYFSNEIIPGDGTMISGDATDGAGNPGFNAQWDTFAGGPWHTGGDGLPVEMVSFVAERNDRGALLRWMTASETGNAGFAIQHAAPGDGFSQIGWVDGVGTTTEAQTYRFVAEDLSAGTHQFRLKQEDVDGTTSLSKTVTLNVRPEGPVAVQPVAPNPVTGTSTLRFTARESGDVSVALYDVLGRKVKQLHEGRVSGGQPQQVTLDASGLSSGVYFLQLTGQGFTKNHRITVAR